MKGETCSYAHEVVMPGLPQSNQQLSVTWVAGKGSGDEALKGPDGHNKALKGLASHASFKGLRWLGWPVFKALDGVIRPLRTLRGSQGAL